MFDEFLKEFFRDPEDDLEYEDMAKGLNGACTVAVVILFICYNLVGGLI